MYYRRKIILALVQQFGGALSRTDLQKLLFLFSQTQSEPSFHFVPYKYGCFSFQANQDVSTMIKYNQIEDSNSKWKIIDNTSYIHQLKFDDKVGLINLYNKFQDFHGEVLIKYVYEKYPYYAINSEIAERILDTEHFQYVSSFKPQKSDFVIFTIGYEGKSVEEYVNQLIKEDVKVLCDVRKNPLSMKYGFSKNQIRNIVENVGIKYLHLPELGIESSKRQELKSPEDYNKLLADYVENILPKNNSGIDKLADNLQKFKRIALTCFEADYQCCHRSRTAEALHNNLNNCYNIQHI